MTLSKVAAAAEATEKAHTLHREEMDKLRKRQLDFTAKIDRIGTRLGKVTKESKTTKTCKVGLKASIRAASNGSRQGTLETSEVI